MTLIIDTCNVLHRTGVLPPELAGVDEDGLAVLLGRSRYRDRTALMVCDGGPGAQKRNKPRPNVRYRFAGRGRTADDVIADLIKSSDAPKRMLVVTSDRAVATLAKRRRCRVLDADLFLEQLALDIARGSPKAPEGRKSGPGAKPLKEHEVENWLEQFELEEDLRDIPPAERPQADPESDQDPPPSREDPQNKKDASSPDSSQHWEDLSTDELFRRFERRSDEEHDRP